MRIPFGTPGLFKRGEIWHIDKHAGGRRIRQGTGTADLEDAERYVARPIETARQAQVYGVRPSRSFDQAAAKFVVENQHKRGLRADIGRLKQLMPWLGDLSLDRLHMGVLQPYIEARRAEHVAVGTINHGLKVVRRILNFAAHEWMDEYGLTWLATAPKSNFCRARINASRIRWTGTSRPGYSSACRTAWRRWPCSPSIRDAGIRRSAIYAGTGK